MTTEHPLHAEARAFMNRRPDLEPLSLDEWLVEHQEILTAEERSEGEALLRRFYDEERPCTDPDDYDDMIAIADEDDWAVFWQDNAEALIEAVGDEVTCRALAMKCELMIGGGAAPLLRVGFVAY